MFTIGYAMWVKKSSYQQIRLGQYILALPTLSVSITIASMVLTITNFQLLQHAFEGHVGVFLHVSAVTEVMQL